jgi:two-component system nitrogen regulation sensor histidine kinase NtrY
MYKKKYIQGIILAIILAILTSYILKQLKYGQRDVVKFQKVLNNKFKYLDRKYSELTGSWVITDYNELSRNGTILLIYRNDSLISWSDNSISLSNIYRESDYENPFIFISNSYYVVKTYSRDNYKVIGLIFIKSEYPYENEFLQNDFQNDFAVSSSAEIITEGTRGSYSVYDWNNQYLFTIVFYDELKFPELTRYLPPFFYLLSFLIILLYLNNYINTIESRLRKNWAIFITGFLFLIFRIVQTRYEFPASAYNLELFGPLPFANSRLLPSLGDLLINTILLAFIIVKFNTDFYFSENLTKKQKFGSNPLHIFLFIVLAGYFVYAYFLFDSLTNDSGISYEAYKVTGLSAYSFIGLLIFALNLASIILIIDTIFKTTEGSYSLEKLLFIFTLILITTIILCFVLDFRIDAYSILFFFLIFLITGLLKYKQVNIYKYSSLVLLVLLFSIYTVYITTYKIRNREKNEMKLMAENLATEHDPVAEYLLEGISEKMSSDKRLIELLFDFNYSSADIYSFLRNKYFTGFWNRYNFRFVDCRPTDSIYFEIPEEQSFQCYEFFDEIVKESGIRLPDSKFYYLDNLNGRINYLGRLDYIFSGPVRKISLFIELESRLISQELGYPELLLDSKLSKNSNLNEYSYAKYFQNRLIAQFGNFLYALKPDVYGETEKDYSFVNFDDFDHLIYRIDEDNTIILSKPSVKFFNLLVSFSYIFAFYYLLVVSSLLIINLLKRNWKLEFNFKNKIQFSIISILFLSLILIGGGTIYFSIEQYKKKHDDNLREKIQSVYIELDHKLAYEEKLTPDWSADKYDNLDQLLIKFSEVFYSDINLYDPNGDLLSTSRSEIFERGLQGGKMNPVAYEKMVVGKQAEFIHREKIGKLEYLAAYVPFVNIENKLLAYLDLPYFTRENLLRKEVTTLVVAIVNVFVLLILLTIAIAILISNQITKPLRLVQQKFGEIKLGRKYEQIQYDRKDEIGSLVTEYNRMVQELARSVDLLAKSERESAWREMAKQIAHEIKNPLTPMKLSVQHLLRSWKDGKEKYGEYVDKVTSTLIEQIDNLSAIAGEFSSFAKMPKAKNQKIDLIQKIKNTTGLFTNVKNIDIKTNFHNNKNVIVFADKEQLSRVFINLLKNAIQSIPEDIRGKIEIDLMTNKDTANVKIKDNGKGIPDEQKDKLFMPNFTTKTSGMGLGLAIVKNIVESCNGKIDFETELDKGTTFIIELPLYKEGDIS